MKILSTLVSVALLMVLAGSSAIAQLPTCGKIYGITSSRIYNFDPAAPVSGTNPSINAIPLPSGGNPALTVCPVLGSSSPTLTFYGLAHVNSNIVYFYYDPATSAWISTGHTTGANLAVNIAAGGGYIYSLVGSTGDVYKYDGTGNGTLLIRVPGFSTGSGPFDLVADCDGNWYILNISNSTGSSTGFLRKYDPYGTLVQTWTISNPQNLLVIASAGFGIIGSTLYTDNRGNNGVAYYTLGATTLTLDSAKSLPTGNAWVDIGSCAGSVPSTPLLTIAASGNVGCPGATITFTATPISGGSAPVYQWKVNGLNAGTNSPVYSYTPVNGDVVSCAMTSNSVCAATLTATSNVLTMAMAPAPLTPVLSIGAPATSVCAATAVTFTATPTNGGVTPVYQWKVNGINAGTKSPTYSYTPANGDVVTCVLTSSISCVTTPTAASNAVAMAVIAVTPAVTVTAAATTVCAGSTTTFTAAPTNGGNAPVYQWKVNGANMGSNSPAYSYVPANGDIVTCVLTSNASCTTVASISSNALPMLVHTVVSPAVSIASSANSICSGAPVRLTATPLNGGTTPAYQWKVNNSNVGFDSAGYTYMPFNGDSIICVLTSNAICATMPAAASNRIVMQVAPPVVPGINANTVPPTVGCEGTPILLVTNIVAGGAAPAYQWYKNGLAIAGATGATYVDNTPKDKDTLRVTLVSSEICPVTPVTWSNYVGLSLRPVVIPAISISPVGPVPTGIPITFTAFASGTGANPVYQWKKNGVDMPFETGVTYTTTGLNGGDRISVYMVSGDACATPVFARSNDVQAGASTGVHGPEADWFITLYPNPNKGSFTVTLSAAAMPGDTWYAIDVINSLGQSIYRTQIPCQGIRTDYTVSLRQDLPEGAYFLRLRTENGRGATLPFVIRY